MSSYDYTHHEEEWDDPILYIVYVPAFLLGLVLCLHGFMLSRRTRYFFGFSTGFYIFYFGVEKMMDDWDAKWALVVVSGLVGLVLGKLTKAFVQLGLFMMGVTFGFALGYNIVLVGAYKMWCPDHLEGYAPFLTFMALIFGMWLLKAERKSRRQLVMVFTSFVGSFTVAQSVDVFTGSYTSYDEIKYRTKGTAARASCADPSDEMVEYVLAELCLFVVGFIVQQYTWKRARAKMKKQHIDEEMNKGDIYHKRPISKKFSINVRVKPPSLMKKTMKETQEEDAAAAEL